MSLATSHAAGILEEEDPGGAPAAAEHPLRRPGFSSRLMRMVMAISFRFFGVSESGDSCQLFCSVVEGHLKANVTQSFLTVLA